MRRPPKNDKKATQINLLATFFSKYYKNKSNIKHNKINEIIKVPVIPNKSNIIL